MHGTNITHAGISQRTFMFPLNLATAFSYSPKELLTEQVPTF